MDENTARRRWEIGRLMSHLNVVSPGTVSENAPRDALGRRVIVAVLPEDSLYDVTQLVRRAGGSAMVSTVMEQSDEHGIAVVGARMVILRTASDETHVPVGRRCTIGDLFRVVGPGASITFTFDDSALLIDDASESPAPPDFADV